MTAAQAKSVSSAIINAGYEALAVQTSPGVWIVVANSQGILVPATDVVNLATAQGVTAAVSKAEFS